MAGTVHIVVGLPGSGKTEGLLVRYRQALANGPPGAALWLSPTQRAAFSVRDRLLTGRFTATFTPLVMTFDRFANRVLEMSPVPIRSLTAGLKRRLVGRFVHELAQGGQLSHFERAASSPGLLDVLSRFIGELKRHEVWPDDFERAAGPQSTAADRELGLIYRRYQDLLTRYSLYDAEGRFWSARQQLRDGHRRAIAKTRLVIADGFTDFTWTQHEILELLAEQAEEVFISLPLEDDRRRRKDLFSKVHRTLDEFQRRHGAAVSIETARPPVSAGVVGEFSGKRHLIEQLFTNPRQPAARLETDALEIIAAGQPVDEVEQVAVRIKRLLLDGDPKTGAAVRPQDVAVVFRSLDEAAPRVREVFDQFGLPYALEAQARLAEAPVLKALRSVLELHSRDWPYRKLRAIVSNIFFAPNALGKAIDRAKAAADWIIGELQIAQGKAALLGKVDWLAAAIQATPSEDSGHATAENSAAERDAKSKKRQFKALRAAPLFKMLEKALAALPDSADLLAWASALERLVIELGMFQSEEDRDAFYALREALAARQRLATWLGEPPESVRQADLLAILDETMKNEPLPSDSDETGRIRILAAPSARALDVPYLFIAGLSEEAFPARQIEDGVLNEPQRRRYIERGLIRLGTRADHIRDEMLLFYEVVTRASRRLWLSYPAMNAKAEPLLPSPLVEEVARVFSGPSLSSPAPSDLSPIPRGERYLCPRDQRVGAVWRALRGDRRAVAELRAASGLGPVAASIVRACRALVERRDRTRFGRFEGLLTTPAARQELRKRFGPETVLSASRLEDYATCPFRFWLSHVLRIEPPPDLALDDDPLTRGLLLHDAMAEAHRRLNEQRGGPTALCGELSPQFVAGFQEALAALLETMARDDPLDAALRRIDRDLLSELVERYVEQFERYADEHGQSLSPAHFEVEFGFPAPDGAAQGAGPLVIGQGDDAVRLAGRIDRIDVGESNGRPVFGVIDYKSGADKSYRPTANVVPTRMQLEIYALAVERLILTGASPVGCGYWFVREKGHKTWLDLREAAEDARGPGSLWERRKQELIDTILRLARAMRDGQFPMYNDDDKCTGRCEYHKTCRVNHARALEKTWSAESEGSRVHGGG